MKKQRKNKEVRPEDIADIIYAANKMDLKIQYNRDIIRQRIIDVFAAADDPQSDVQLHSEVRKVFINLIEDMEELDRQGKGVGVKVSDVLFEDIPSRHVFTSDANFCIRSFK